MKTIIDAVIAAIAAFIIVSILFLFFLFLIHHILRLRGSRGIPGHPVSARPPISSLWHLDHDDESASFDPSLRQVSMSELVRATNNFDPESVIGDGSFGLVYAAKLAASSSGDISVALKKLVPNAFHGQREFRAEMETLGKLRHRNLVRLLGYCVSGAERVLIYEFIEKGSLDQWLHDTESFEEGAISSRLRPRPYLDWDTRVKIVKGVADGLAFLHGLQTPIVHRDIKAGNVLLDADFEAHIADFGLARSIEGDHSHVWTQVAGTTGYMPPEYNMGLAAATVRADTYSFGVLMFEVASGRRPNWPFREGEAREMMLVEWAKKKLADGKAVEMVDMNLPVREEVVERGAVAVEEFARIADLCTRRKPKERPTMAHVVELMGGLS